MTLVRTLAFVVVTMTSMNVTTAEGRPTGSTSNVVAKTVGRIMSEIGFKEAIIVIQIVAFLIGTVFRALLSRNEKESMRFGFRVVYILIPAFFAGYYSSDFLLKDRS